MSPLPGSTATCVGLNSDVWLAFKALPVSVPSALSMTPLVPICSNILLPSCVYFWTIPSLLPAVQKLPSLSMKQPCWVLAITSRLPHELTTLPSASNSITGGAGVARFLSLGAGCPLVTTNTWSRASTQTLPTDPSTHPSGNGFGQDGSYLNCGTATLARADTCVMDTKVTTLIAATATAAM